MAGFILDHTLRRNGTVTRGICEVDERDSLKKIRQTGEIICGADGVIKDENGNQIPPDTPVSMNMWGLTLEFLEVLDSGFVDSLAETEPDNMKTEYLLPSIIGVFLKEKTTSVKVLETRDHWFGVTYQEDRQNVMEAFRKLIETVVYSTRFH